MRAFGSATTALITIGFFALNTFSAPFPWNHPSRPSTNPPTSSTSSSGSTTSGSTTSGSTTSGSTTSGSTTSGSTSSGSDSSSGGSGTPGQATIVNKCTFPTFLYVCKQHPATCGNTVTLASNTGNYAEAYAPSSDGGHAIKISVNEGSGDILQFEYTNEGNGEVSYDLSEVNGNPFGTWGFSLTNTTTDAYCAPPATSCPAIFTAPTNGIPYTAPTSDGVGAILCG